MIPTFYTYLLVCPLTFLAGLVDAVAGGDEDAIDDLCSAIDRFMK